MTREPGSFPLCTKDKWFESSQRSSNMSGKKAPVSVNSIPERTRSKDGGQLIRNRRLLAAVPNRGRATVHHPKLMAATNRAKVGKGRQESLHSRPRPEKRRAETPIMYPRTTKLRRETTLIQRSITTDDPGIWKRRSEQETNSTWNSKTFQYSVSPLPRLMPDP